MLPSYLKQWMTGSSSESFRYSRTHLIFEIPTNFPPQSAPEKLCNPMSPWHLLQPMACTLSTTLIFLDLLPLPVWNVRLVIGWDPRRPCDTKSIRSVRTSVLGTRHRFPAIYFHPQRLGLDKELECQLLHVHAHPQSLCS